MFREHRKASANVTGAETHTRTSVYAGGRIATTANSKLISPLITFGQHTSDTTATAAAATATNTEAADGRAATDDRRRRRAYSGGGVRRLGRRAAAGRLLLLLLFALPPNRTAAAAAGWSRFCAQGQDRPRDARSAPLKPVPRAHVSPSPRSSRPMNKSSYHYYIDVISSSSSSTMSCTIR